MSDSDKILKSGQVLRIWREVEYPRLKSLMYRAYSGKFARPKEPADGDDFGLGPTVRLRTIRVHMLYP
jgi:hypothetical protein